MSHTISASDPKRDQTQAVEFLAAIDPAATNHCCQTFDDSPRKDPRLARTLLGSLATVWPTLAKLNDAGAGIFFTPNEMTPGKPRRIENAVRVRAFFADSDEPARLAHVEAEIARRGRVPSIIVETSPGKRHFYWIMNDCPLSGFKPMQQAIAAPLGTDPSVCDLPRVMRLPGFVHRKGAPFLVRVVAMSGILHSHAEMMTAYPAAPSRPSPASPRRLALAHPTQPSDAAANLRAWIDQFGGLITPAVRAAIAEAQHGTRHRLLRAIVARLVPVGWPAADIRGLVLPAAAAAWPDTDPCEVGERLDRLIVWVQAQEARKIAATRAAPASVAAAFGAARRAAS